MTLMVDAPQVEALFPSRTGRSTTKVAVEHELVSRDVVDGSVPRIERIAAAHGGGRRTRRISRLSPGDRSSSASQPQLHLMSWTRWCGEIWRPCVLIVRESVSSSMP